MKRILWVDDEIDFLKPHIMFLQSKGYEVTCAVSGTDAIEMLEKTPDGWDAILLDENMPGLTGIETLEKLKIVSPHTPVVMITKSEEESLMDQAVGNQIKDYLIKPVNPNQILSSLKKLLHADRLITEQATVNYRKEFMDVSNLIASASSFNEWCDIYRRLTLRMLDFNDTAPDIAYLLEAQYNEAQKEFFRFIRKNYMIWMERPETAPLMSHNIMETQVLPSLSESKKTVMLVIDNFRLDLWLSVKPVFTDLFHIENEMLYCSILPTATQYARNALFSGQLPADIKRKFPELWIDEDAEESKNLNEKPLIENLLRQTLRFKQSIGYYKANNSQQLSGVIKSLSGQLCDLTVIVINFIDILSHARTDINMIRELASTEAAYRSLALSWFRHSPFHELLENLARKDVQLFCTTDHGTVKVDRPVKVVGERETNAALRYKHGRNLAYPNREVFAITQPHYAGLPAPNVSSTYIFAGMNDFFAYPNNYNHYVKYFNGTYQHGGVSFEEMIVPFIKLAIKS